MSQWVVGHMAESALELANRIQADQGLAASVDIPQELQWDLVLHIEDPEGHCRQWKLVAYIQGLSRLAQAREEPVGQAKLEIERHIVESARHCRDSPVVRRQG
jgi:hypothetical protein